MKKEILICSATIFISLALLLIVVYSVFNLAWNAKLKNIVAKIEKEGGTLDIMAIAPAPVPDGENAAVELNKAFSLMSSSAPGKQFIASKSRGELDSKIKAATDFNKLSEFLEWPETKKKDFSDAISSTEIDEIISLLKKASEKPGYNFNLSYQDGYATLLPHLSPLKNSVRLLCGRALFEAEKGNRDTAYRLLHTSLRISRYSGTEPTLISCLVEFACFAITVDAIDFIVDKYGISSSEAAAFIDVLEKTDFNPPLLKAMNGEMAMASMFFKKIIDGRMSSKEFEDAVGMNQIKPPILMVKRDYSFYISKMSETINLFAQPYWEIKNQLETTSKIPRYYPLSLIFLPSIPSIKLKEAKTGTLRNICELNLALHIYKNKNGRYPDSLEALKPDILREIPIDCISGKNLSYKNEGASYMLCSESIETEKKKRGTKSR